MGRRAIEISPYRSDHAEQSLIWEEIITRELMAQANDSCDEPYSGLDQRPPLEWKGQAIVFDGMVRIGGATFQLCLIPVFWDADSGQHIDEEVKWFYDADAVEALFETRGDALGTFRIGGQEYALILTYEGPDWRSRKAP